MPCLLLLSSFRTCGLTPSIFSDGGTFKPAGICMCPKSTVNASHHIPKWPMSKMVRSPGKVNTTVFLSYFRKGVSLPFSSGILMPCGDGLDPEPAQNLASVNENQTINKNNISTNFRYT